MRYLLCLVVLVAGCASEEDLRARRQQEYAQQLAAQAAYRERVQAQCRAYGFSDGAPEFRQCLMQVDQANQHRDAQERSVILQQLLHEDAQQRRDALPLCSQYGPGLAGYYRKMGRCR